MLLVTRSFVWATAVLSAVVLGARNAFNAGLNDDPRLSTPPGLGHAVLTPLAHWDSIWYLGIVEHGYRAVGGYGQVRAAFFPLYPLLVWVGSGFGASPGLQLVAAFVVSMAAFGGALYLLHRLAALELGREYALPTIVLLAAFPGALFFGLPYSESVFLLVSVGAVYAARGGRWAYAGLLAAAASATRSAGLLLLVPLLILYLHGPRGDRAPDDRDPTRGSRLRPVYRVRPDLLWLALAPAGLVAYSAYLGIRHGDALAWLHAQKAWSRTFAGPFFALGDGASAAWHGVRQLVSGSESAVYLHRGQLNATRGAIEDVALFALALGALAATVGTLRRLPLAYGAYVVAALSLPLSFPAAGQALESLPRFLAVLFPLFMWLALWTRERRATDAVTLVFAALLGLCAAEYAAWEFVS